MLHNDVFNFHWLYGTLQLSQMEQHLLVNLSYEAVKCASMNTSSIEFKGIHFASDMKGNFILR